MTDRSWPLDSMLAETRERLQSALTIVESIDDPYPGADLIAVAVALDDALSLTDVLILSRQLCPPEIPADQNNHDRP